MTPNAQEIFRVPVVDLEGPRAAADLDAACRSVGFLALVDHGIPDAVIDRMRSATDALFALPLADKLRWASPRPEVNRGYACKGSEALGYGLGGRAGRAEIPRAEIPPDLFEAFNIGPEASPGGDPGPSALSDPNIWPDGRISRGAAPVPDLRPALMDYFAHARQVAHRLTALAAVALGLPEDFFVSMTDHSTDTMRVNNYERAPGEADAVDGQQRMGAHTDYGIVTVLYADPVPGLQIIGPDGSWRDVVPVEGTLVVNLGDLMAQWTNDHWRSTIHRVVPPPPGLDGPSRRRSVAFFHDGNDDALVECLPTCRSATDPAKYRPVRAGDHLRAKLLGPRTLTTSEATSTAGDRLGP